MTHFHIGFFEFLVWSLYYILFKAVVIFINIETRRNKLHIPAGVSGLIS